MYCFFAFKSCCVFHVFGHGVSCATVSHSEPTDRVLGWRLFDGGHFPLMVPFINSSADEPDDITDYVHNVPTNHLPSTYVYIFRL